MISYLDAHSPFRIGNPFPPYIYLPRSLGHFAGYNINGQYAGWLGKTWDPLATAIQKRHATDNPYFRDCTDDELDFRFSGLDPVPKVTLDRIIRRQSLLNQLDHRRWLLEQSSKVRTFSVQREQAMNLLMSGNVAQALDMRPEPVELRDCFGRNLFGQSLLMGRRLIEAGSRFVTVAWDMAVRGDDTTSWDSHRDLTRVMKHHLLPGLDQGLSALLDDMGNTGLLDETLIFVAGEMGRTPKFENRGSKDGRDHWSYCFPCLLDVYPVRQKGSGPRFSPRRVRDGAG